MREVIPTLSGVIKRLKANLARVAPYSKISAHEAKVWDSMFLLATDKSISLEVAGRVELSKVWLSYWYNRWRDTPYSELLDYYFTFKRDCISAGLSANALLELLNFRLIAAA